MYFKQVQEIVDGTKRCTQRVVKPGEVDVLDVDGTILAVRTPKGVLKWRVGGVYCVSPTRGWPTALWKLIGDVAVILKPKSKAIAATFMADGYEQVKIRVVKIERCPVQSMDETVARAEGVAGRLAYIALWSSINKTRGVRWEDNPEVRRLWFEFVG
jgi:hypothetical protein